MKRILVGYVIGDHACGIDTYLFGMIRALSKDGYRFDLLTQASNDVLRSLCEETDSRLIEVPSLKSPIKRFQTIRKVIKENKYDTGYFNISEAFNSIDVIVAKLCKVKRIIVHSHSAGTNETSPIKRPIRIAIHKFFKQFILGSCATDFFACSDIAAKWMFTKKVMASDSVQYVSNAVEKEKYEFNADVREQVRTDLGLGNYFVIGHISGFTEQKNIGFLIDIIDEVRKLDPSTKLLLVGEGREQDKIREKVQALSLEEHVSFLGKRTDIPRLLQAMDMFVFPSLFEGLPFALVEAQMAGLRIFASDAITSETKLSEKYTALSLQLTAEEWARQIVAAKEYDRANTYFTNESFDMKKQKDVLARLF